MKKIKIQIFKRNIRTGEKCVLEINGDIITNNFDEHDTAAVLFALEFAANNHTEVPMRVYITTL